MQRFFNMDNPFFRTLGRLADLMILNLLFLVCCIPIVTIGASTTAMFYVTLKIAENDEGYIAKGFFHSFRQNFRQATIIWCICLAVIAVLGIDYRILTFAEPSRLIQAVTIGLLATAVLFLIVYSYVFPVLSRFDNTVRNTIVNAFLMSVINLPYTLLILVLTIGPVLITLINSYTIWYGILFWILCGFALCAYAKSLLFKKIFARFMPAPEQEEDPDKWEVEMPEGTTPEGTTGEDTPDAAAEASPGSADKEDSLKLDEDVWAAFDAAVSLDESEDVRGKGSDAPGNSPGDPGRAGYAPVPRFGEDGRVISEE